MRGPFAATAADATAALGAGVGAGAADAAAVAASTATHVRAHHSAHSGETSCPGGVALKALRAHEPAHHRRREHHQRPFGERKGTDTPLLARRGARCLTIHTLAIWLWQPACSGRAAVPVGRLRAEECAAHRPPVGRRHHFLGAPAVIIESASVPRIPARERRRVK